MSVWNERVTKHGVWESMKSLGPAIDDAIQVADGDTAAIDGLERLRAALTFTGKRLAGADVQIVAPAALDTIDGAFRGLLSDVSSYISTGDESHITSANGHADQVLMSVPLINYFFVSDDWNAARDTALAYRNTLEKAAVDMHATVDGLARQVDQVQTTAQTIADEMSAQAAKADELAKEQQAVFEAAEEGRASQSGQLVQCAIDALNASATDAQEKLAELRTEIAAERDRIEATQKEFETRFEAAETERQAEASESAKTQGDAFEAMIRRYGAELEKQNTTANGDLAQLRKTYEAGAKAVLEQVQLHKADVEKLVGVIGNLGVTSGYQRTANRAWRTMLAWQGLAVLAMICVIWFAYMAFLPFTNVAFDWTSFAGKLVLTIAVGSLSAYAAFQGDKQYTIERRNRKLALELEAIGPYLAPLPEEKQHAFRLSLGERTFGLDDSNAAVVGAADRSPSNLAQVVLESKQLREVIAELSEVVKAIKPGV